MSSSNSAFNLQGALPKTSIGGTSSPLSIGTSPMGNALNNAKTSPFSIGALAPQQKPYVPPAPSTPVKKITSSDGTTTEFHAPAKASSGVLPSAASQGTPPAQTPAQVPSQPQSPALGSSQGSQAPLTYPGLLGEIRGAAEDTSVVDKANSDLENLRKSYATAVGNTEDSGYLPMQFVQGKEQVLGRQFASQESAAQQALSNALTARGQNIGALQGVAGALAPRQNGYVLIDPATGKLVNGGGGNESPITQGAQYDAQYQGALGNAQDNQAITGAQNNIDSITQLINNSGLNAKGINVENAAYNTLKENMSSSDIYTLNNALASIDSALSKVTGAPVDIAQLSTAQGTSLIATINNQVQLAKGIAAGKINNAGGSNQSSSSDPLGLGI